MKRIICTVRDDRQALIIEQASRLMCQYAHWEANFTSGTREVVWKDTAYRAFEHDGTVTLTLQLSHCIPSPARKRGEPLIAPAPRYVAAEVLAIIAERDKYKAVADAARGVAIDFELTGDASAALVRLKELEEQRRTGGGATKG